MTKSKKRRKATKIMIAVGPDTHTYVRLVAVRLGCTIPEAVTHILDTARIGENAQAVA